MPFPVEPTNARPNRRRATLIAAASAALLAACATEAPRPQSMPAPMPGSPILVTPPAATVPNADEAALRQLVGLQERLDRVAAPLLVNNTPLCRGHARRLLGFTAKTRYSYSADYTAAAEKLFHLDERLQVTGVLPGSGALKAGVLRGDKLVAVNDKPLPQGANAERQAAAILSPLVNRHSALKLTVMRDGINRDLEVPLTPACAFRVELGNIDMINAYSDGHRVLVTRGMMSFTKSDAELALVVGRELAHNVLGHPAKMHSAAAIGGVIDNLIRSKPDLGMTRGTAGIKPYSQESDVAADTTGLYMTARAGYPVDAAANFWQRLANQTPSTMPDSYTAIHPSTAARLAAIDKTVADIDAKVAAKKPLQP